MKDGLKSLGILIIGLFVAVFLYPFLHETGHTIAAVLIGAEVTDITLYPIPSVLCNSAGVGDRGLVTVGFGGVVFPVLVSLIHPRKCFFAWYVRVLLQGMSVLALGVSFVSVLFKVNPHDDMIQVLRFWQYGEPMLLLILSLGIVIMVIIVCSEKPGHRLCDFFEV